MQYQFFRTATGALCLLITASFLLNGCATLTREECLTVDWYELGFEDGSRGYRTSRIADHRKACAEYGVATDLDRYRAGHTEGLRLYCTPSQGYRNGLSGRSFNDMCSGELHAGFRQGYQQGREIYLFESDIKAEKRELDKLDREIQDLRELIHRKEGEITNGCSPPSRCRKLLDEVRELDHDLDHLLSEYDHQRDRIEELEQDLATMKRHTY